MQGFYNYFFSILQKCWDEQYTYVENVSVIQLTKSIYAKILYRNTCVPNLQCKYSTKWPNIFIVFRHRPSLRNLQPFCQSQRWQQLEGLLSFQRSTQELVQGLVHPDYIYCLFSLDAWWGDGVCVGRQSTHSQENPNQIKETVYI